MVKANELNSVTLAYIGDAVYELHVRRFLIEAGNVKPNELHQLAVQYVSAPAQANVIKHWLEEKMLTREEEAVFRRGRNAKTHSSPKNISVEDYKYSTGFEALIGYLYLKNDEKRLNELIEMALKKPFHKDD